ncbi:hypothetical protein GCM10011583_60400 [Streptomyces camponoticapitis]|uniref:Uncharacterized protein n=1 Tax=Streptomyces camponoticapitis TaxID=1616125 RepID=A0ABQ2EQS0_9ACTN|nr:zinc-binding dehydrogenase [Streptomyces camponoticapitis]GGK20419.1 hypothetical protein GCM10011583_60400 [Streptomyces camponoticapitis]
MHKGGAILALRRTAPSQPGRTPTPVSTQVLAFVPDYRDEGHRRLDRLRGQVEAGELTPRVTRVLSTERTAEVHRLMEADGVRGRLVVEF